MDLNKMFFDPAEQPFDQFPADGGFVGIFRTIACIGDSLSSGEFEAVDPDGKRHFLDWYEYSWGQNLARMAGCKVYNFSAGGMTARGYMEWFGEQRGFFAEDLAAQAYIVALGSNDLIAYHHPLGDVSDIAPDDWRKNNPETFMGSYGQIIGRYKEIQPKAKFFLVTLPNIWSREKEIADLCDAQAEAVRQIAELYDNCYVIDLNRYVPDQLTEAGCLLWLNGHQNAMGYLLTGKMMVSYIDYIIRHNMKDFVQVPFIGTPYYRDELDVK